MLLAEIKALLDMKPLEFKWLDSERCIFELKDSKIGIFAEFQNVELDDIKFGIANIAFGTYLTKFTSAADLNLGLTGNGLARTVFSTVGAACLANHEIMTSDVVILGASDSVKEKRSLLYSLATEEIRTKDARFKNHSTIRVKTSNGTILNLLTSVSLTDTQQTKLASAFNLQKV